MKTYIIAALVATLTACAPVMSTATDPPEDNCDPGIAECPSGFTDNCAPTSKIIGSCCYEAHDGRRNPIGICEPPPPPPPCDGCVNATGQCRPGNSVDACGIGGESCLSCMRPNGTAACVAGACSEPVTCSGFWMDCDGDPSNGCEMPMTDAANCGACGNSCGGGGSCEESCDPPTNCTFTCVCGGCFAADGTCASGNADLLCGHGGVQCQNCGAGTCVDGACK